MRVWLQVGIPCPPNRIHDVRARCTVHHAVHARERVGPLRDRADFTDHGLLRRSIGWRTLRPQCSPHGVTSVSEQPAKPTPHKTARPRDQDTRHGAPRTGRRRTVKLCKATGNGAKFRDNIDR